MLGFCYLRLFADVGVKEVDLAKLAEKYGPLPSLRQVVSELILNVDRFDRSLTGFVYCDGLLHID